MNDNRMKSINGVRIKKTLIEILKDLQSDEITVCCNTNYRCGYAGMINDQFFAPFCIEFRNGEKWILFSTNSIRHDRLCIQQWNADNIKKIDDSVKKALVVVPSIIRENEKEYKEAERYKEKLLSKKYYSALDDVVIQDELKQYIQDNSCQKGN